VNVLVLNNADAVGAADGTLHAMLASDELVNDCRAAVPVLGAVPDAAAAAVALHTLPISESKSANN
jgi:hypothetical protein